MVGVWVGVEVVVEVGIEVLVLVVGGVGVVVVVGVEVGYKMEMQQIRKSSIKKRYNKVKILILTL